MYTITIKISAILCPNSEIVHNNNNTMNMNMSYCINEKGFTLSSLFQDLNNLYDQYRAIEPWLQRKDGLEKDGREHYQSVDDRKKLVS